MLLQIVYQNIVPVLLIISAGLWLGKKYPIDVRTLSRLNVQVFVPAFVFVGFYTVDLQSTAGVTAVYALSFFVVMLILAALVANLGGLPPGRRAAFANAVSFYNAGNIGIPLITLVFSSELYRVDGEAVYLSLALGAQVIVMVVQNLTTNTLGFVFAGRAHMNGPQLRQKILSLPTIYALPAALIMRQLPVTVEGTPIWMALEYARGALVPIALITLGAQMAKSRIRLRSLDVLAACGLRLLAGPVVAVLLLKFFGVNGVLGQVLLISSAVPSSVATVMIALECDNHPAFAADTVVLSTVFSTFTLAAAIFAAGLLFPVS